LKYILYKNKQNIIKLNYISVLEVGRHCFIVSYDASPLDVCIKKYFNWQSTTILNWAVYKWQSHNKFWKTLGFRIKWEVAVYMGGYEGVARGAEDHSLKNLIFF
jgi:hypothetical protein